MLLADRAGLTDPVSTTANLHTCEVSVVSERLRYVLVLLAVGGTPAYPAGADNPECRWSRNMRSDPSVYCPGDDRRDAGSAVSTKPASGAISAVSSADLQIPVHDVDGSCAKDSWGPEYLAACIRQEQSSYNMVKLLWRSASPRAKRESITYAEGSKAAKAYYHLMEVSLESAARDEQAARDRAAPPRFQR